MGSIGGIVAVIGLGALVAFGQTSRHVFTGRFSSLAGLLSIPAAVALLWRLGIDFGWWTIGIFILVSLVVGIVNHGFARRFGPSFLYAMQPLQAVIWLTATGIAWLLPAT